MFSLLGLGALVSLGLFFYLLIALLLPERLQ